MLHRVAPQVLTVPAVPAVPKQPERRTITRSARSMGIYLLAGRGTGKSRLLGRKIAIQDFFAGFPQVIFDPIGATIDNFLDKVLWFLADHPHLAPDGVLERIMYIDMSGKDGGIVPFPLYYRLGTERSLLEIAERYLQTIIKSNPDLFHAQVLGWPPLHRIGVYTGMILSALGYQITEAENLLRQPEQWVSRFTEAERRYPEAAPAVSFFRNEYIPMRDQDRARLTTPFLDKIFTFSLDPTLRAIFGAKSRGLTGTKLSRKNKRFFLISGESRMRKCAGSRCSGHSRISTSGSKPGADRTAIPLASSLMNLPI
jgi:hypothetical protein